MTSNLNRDSRPDAPPPNEGETMEEVLDRYLAEVAEGGEPDQEEYLRRHPAMAGALRSVFKTLRFLEETGRAQDGSRLESGRTLGDFTIVREIGRGGMGVVYEAIQTSLDRRVALKVLPTGAMLVARSAPERFAREAAIAGRLHHTNIVPVYAVGEEQGIHYFAMQYIEGHSLSMLVKELRASGEPLDSTHYARVAKWGRQVGEALEHAHEQGTIHRDIKPSNLLVDERDDVWITDFGLARRDAQATITFTGDIVGTARYMSPEQASGGKRLDRRTDVYSLGATLYELLALHPAFDGDSREEVLIRITTSGPRPLRAVDHRIPRDLETIVMKCMAHAGEERYARARDVAEDCRRFLAGEPILARRTPLAVRALRLAKRHRTRLAAAIVLLALAGTIAFMFRESRRDEGLRRLGEAYDAFLFERDYLEGRRLLDEAASLGIDTPELDLYRGLIPLLEGRPTEAFVPLGRVLDRHPDHVEAGLALAFAQTQAGDYHTGQRTLAHFGKLEIPSALGWLLHGRAEGLTQGSAAIASYDRAIELQPDFTPAIIARAGYRGIRLLVEGDRTQLEPMLNDFGACAIFRPQSSRSYAERAHGLLLAAAYAESVPELRQRREEWLAACRGDIGRALELRRDDDSFALLEQGQYLRYIGDHRGAGEALGKAIAIQRRVLGAAAPLLVHDRAVALHATGDLVMALDEVAPASAAAPTLYALWLHRAMLLAELGRIREAQEVGRRTLDEVRGNATALYLAAVVAELLGDREAARTALLDLEARDPHDVTFEDARQTSFGPALDYLLERIDAPTLLASVAGDPGRTCELSFLVALREFSRGRRQAGLAALRAVLSTGVCIYGEYRFAGALLARAEADPDWPRWVLTFR